MRVELARQGDGIQFVIHAESDAESLVIAQFLRQVGAETFHLHGVTNRSGCIGPSSFNFGTIPKGPSVYSRSFTPEQKAEVERLLREQKSVLVWPQ